MKTKHKRHIPPPKPLTRLQVWCTLAARKAVARFRFRKGW